MEQLPSGIMRMYWDLLYTTILIQTKDNSKGTAFAFEYERNGALEQFLVTNRHVIEGHETGWLTFTKAISCGDNDIEPVRGETVRRKLEGFSNQWHCHPESTSDLGLYDIDIAVLPLQPVLKQFQQENRLVYYKAFGVHELPNERNGLYWISPTSEVHFIGYPIGVYDNKNYMPVTRRGLTATAYQDDYDGQAAFLIDASVFPGSSGSPIYRVSPHSSYLRSKGRTLGATVHLLGILSSVICVEDDMRLTTLPIPTEAQPIITHKLTDLGLAFKVSAIVETIEDYWKSTSI